MHGYARHIACMTNTVFKLLHTWHASELLLIPMLFWGGILEVLLSTGEPTLQVEKAAPPFPIPLLAPRSHKRKDLARSGAPCRSDGQRRLLQDDLHVHAFAGRACQLLLGCRPGGWNVEVVWVAEPNAQAK